jgi:hypothetical protein
MSEMLEKRIYIVSIGLKSEWILGTLKELRPDKVYIFENQNENNKDYFKVKNKIIKEISKKEIQKVEKKYSGNEYNLLRMLKTLVENHSQDTIYLNLDSGDRRISSTFILSSFLFKSINPRIFLVSFNSDLKEINEFPSFKVKLPHKALIEVLKEIQTLEDFCTKKKLSEVLIRKKILEVKINNPQNILMALNRKFIQKLIDWNFIEVDGRSKNSLIKITFEGQKWLKFM